MVLHKVRCANIKNMFCLRNKFSPKQREYLKNKKIFLFDLSLLLLLKSYKKKLRKEKPYY